MYKQKLSPKNITKIFPESINTPFVEISTTKNIFQLGTHQLELIRKIKKLEVSYINTEILKIA